MKLRAFITRRKIETVAMTQSCGASCLFAPQLAAIFCLTVLALMLFAAPVAAASTAKDYVERLQQTGQSIRTLAKRKPAPQPAEVVAALLAAKQSLPAREEVEIDGQIVSVNNAWLHEEIDLAIKNANGDEEQLYSELIEMADRLDRLRQRVSPAQQQSGNAAQDERARLERILSRSEYAPEEEKESALQRGINKAQRWIGELLARIFGARRASSGFVFGSVSIVRMILALAVLLAAVIGLAKLSRRMQARRRKETNEKREVLGEELADDATASELLSRAKELARQGDFRSAIRLAYIALLCEMEQRGKVRLHRAKTNRDYLDELKPEPAIFPTFSVMTGAFEHVWYGHEPATESEFNDFITLYQETVQ